MKLGFKRGEKGFTLIEIIIVLAVLGVLAAVVVPNVQGFLGQGKDRSYSADRDILQAAVDGWRTDFSNRAGNLWPTIGGVIGDPDDADADGAFTDEDDVNSFIDIAELADGGFLKNSATVKSSAKDATNVGSTNTNNGGSYYWYIDSNGVVESWYPADDTLGEAAGVDIDAGEKGFQSGIYP